MMDCKDCLPLIPSYVDRELSEVQSGPLRQHLMDCQACRKALAGQKSLERWFASPAAAQVEVPAGFAARVARRAFAGDQGTFAPDLETAEAGAVVAVKGAKTPIYSFVLWATAAAAGLLLIVSGMLFQVQVGDGPNMHAGPLKDKSLPELLEAADRMDDPARADDPGVAPEDVLEDMSDKTSKKPGKARLENEDK